MCGGLSCVLTSLTKFFFEGQSKEGHLLTFIKSKNFKTFSLLFMHLEVTNRVAKTTFIVVQPDPRAVHLEEAQKNLGQVPTSSRESPWLFFQCSKGRRASKRTALHLTPQTARKEPKKMLVHMKVLSPQRAPMWHPENPPSLIPRVSKDQAG